MYISRVTAIFIFLVLWDFGMALGQLNNSEEIDPGKASLDTVWQTVNEYHYDTTFGGMIVSLFFTLKGFQLA